MGFFGAEKEKSTKARRRRGSAAPFKGVRMRKWGRWVSEIRVPRTRARIWLGSYKTAEMAARAYDAALYCLRGPRGQFNFPGERRPEFPGRFPPVLSKADVKAIATTFSASGPSPLPPPSSSCSSLMSSSSAVSFVSPSSALADSGEVDGAGNSLFRADGILGSGEFLPESFLGPCTWESKNIWEIIGMDEQ